MKTVISCSRRTDIPAFFLDWLLSGFFRGKVNVKHPITKKWRTVLLDPQKIHTLVLWSKNFQPVIQRWDEFASLLTDKEGRTRITFQFTINSFFPLLEPGLNKSLDERIAQVEILAELTTPLHINWRFDPIVFWREDKTVKDNLQDFDYLIENLSAIGVNRCYFSFATWYGKCRRRAQKKGFNYIEPTLKEKLAITKRLVNKISSYDMILSNCCNPEVFEVPKVHQLG
ncbi:MAG: DUF1848 family protein, partial [Candidatus Hodarchaeota archaeon]